MEETISKNAAAGGTELPLEHYWGAQTERARRELSAGTASETVPCEIIRAFGILKKAAARVNFDLLPERMNEEKCAAIFAAADEVIRRRLADEFPLAVWQAGAGEKTNVNVNEVIARRGCEMADEPLLCPDDVNLSQPPDGAFAAAAHIAAALAVEERLLPAVETMVDVLTRREDAALRRENIERGRDALRGALAGLYPLTLGGAETAAPEGYAEAVAAEVARQTGRPFVPADGAEPEAGALGGLLAAHGAMRLLTGGLLSAADALRAAPRSEGADSALCERLEVTAAQITGNGAALGFAAARGGAGAAVFLPVCAYNFLQSARLLSESIMAFATEYGDEEG